MHQTNLCNWLLKGALALAVIAGGVDSASAGWWHNGGGSSGGGSSGGWGSSGGYGGGSSGGWGSSGGYSGAWGGGSSGGYGRRGGLFSHRRASFGGSSGGYYGGGSSGGWGNGGSSGGFYGGGSSGGYGSSGGAVMGGGYYAPGGDIIIEDGGIPMNATPTNPPPPPAGEGDAADAPPETDGAMLRRADGTLVVEVPAEARIYVNDRLTSTPGTMREYVSRNLVRGYNYSYEVRAEMEVNGQVVSETKKIDLRAGQNAKLAFNLAPSTSEEVETSITVKVPANAKVNLGGNDTKAKGETRTFRTSALRKGTEWKDYKIVVTANVDGVEVTKEQTFNLQAGEEKELSFEFDAASVAAR